MYKSKLKRRTHSLGNISQQQCRAVFVVALHKLHNLVSLRLSLIVQIEVDHVHSRVGMVHTGANGDTEEVAYELVDWASGRGEALEEGEPWFLICGPDEGCDRGCYAAEDVLKEGEYGLRCN